MLRILALIFVLILAGCIEEPPASNPSFVAGDAGVDDAGQDAGEPADDMSVAPDAMPDMSLDCSTRCPELGAGAYFTDCNGCEFACEPDYEKCDSSCAPVSQTAEACGACVVESCLLDDTAQNAIGVCTEELECSFVCEEDFLDVNDDPTDGCECTVADDFGDGIDENCDGVDGLVEEFVFVTNASGDDTNDGKTPATAVETLNRAYEIALMPTEPERRTIILEGTAIPYDSSVVIETQSVRIIGGWSVSTDLEWTQTTARSRLNTSDPTTPVLEIKNLGASESVELTNLDIRGPNQPVAGAAAYTVRVDTVTAASALVFENVIIRGGSGGNGERGMDGMSGAQGGNGTKGADATDLSMAPNINPGGAGGISNCGSQGDSNGGNGGNATRCNADSATDGEPGLLGGVETTPRGNGGDNRCVTLDSEGDGTTGSNGLNGDGGDRADRPVNPAGTFDANLFWVPPTTMAGARGEHGAGGGGGGGAGTTGGVVAQTVADLDLGPGGSGGGGGGCGGFAGQPGEPGGASIALTVYESTVDLGNLEIAYGPGGQGGDGGNGGCGGAGGMPGALGATGTGTGNPGPGGRGGTGGAGAGGNGGPGGSSFGLVTIGGNVNRSNISFSGNPESTGGDAGLSGVGANSANCLAGVGEDGQKGENGQVRDVLEL